MKNVKSLLQHTGARKYFFNTSWMLFEQGLRLVAGLFVGAWMARFLGPSKYGIFSYALSYLLIFQAAAKLGLDDIIIKKIIEKPAKTEEILGTSFWMKFGASIFFMIMMFLIVIFSEEDANSRIYITIVSFALIFRSFEVVDFYFRSQVQARFISTCRIIQLILNTILKIVLILNEASLAWFVFTILLEHIMLGLFYYVAFRIEVNKSFLKIFKLEVAKDFITSSWPLMLSSFAVMIYTRVDQVMIKEFLNDASVGIYAASFRVTEILYTIPIILCNSLFPAIVNAKNRDPAIYKIRLQRLYSFLIFLSLSCAGFITFFSNEIILALYGKAYAGAAEVLVIQAWTLVFVSFGTVGTRWYLTEGLQKLELWRNIFGAAVNILLNFILIPKYGIFGAAWSSLCGFFVSSLLFDLIHPKGRASFYLKMAGLNPLRLFSSSTFH